MRVRTAAALVSVAAMVAMGAAALLIWRSAQEERARRASAILRRADYFNSEERLQVPLRDAELFSSLQISVTGTASPPAQEFVRLLGEPNAERLLVDLFDRGASGARLYALCGLTALNPTKATSYKASLDVDRRDVGMVKGCSGVSITPPGEAAASAQFKEICDELLEAHRAAQPIGVEPDGRSPAAPARR